MPDDTIIQFPTSNSKQLEPLLKANIDILNQYLFNRHGGGVMLARKAEPVEFSGIPTHIINEIKVALEQNKIPGKNKTYGDLFIFSCLNHGEHSTLSIQFQFEAYTSERIWDAVTAQQIGSYPEGE